MRIWVDLANSPHVPFFAAIAAELERDGHTVELTARDHAQTVPLARATWPDVEVIGGASPPGRAAKALAVAQRAVALARFARAHKADVALSHGSYAQVAAARAAGLPGVTMMDYEHQPANHVSFRLATRVVLPEAFPADAARRFGARAHKVIRYDGFKEQVYLAGFAPEGNVRAELGIADDAVLVVLRPPPSGALYHGFGNAVFDDVLSDLGRRPGLALVVLPRTEAQRAAATERAPNAIVPAAPVDGRSLLATADAVVGAGGTVTREAALLGVPTWSVFAGRPASVDAELSARGLLAFLHAGEVLPEIGRSARRDASVPATAADAVHDAVRRALAEAVDRRR
jgi:predicted glycosyltransferase